MTPEITQLRAEFANINIHETSMMRGCIADLIKDKADKNLLNICLIAGVLQDYFLENLHDTFFINRCKTKLIEEYFINETAAEMAIAYCKFLAQKEAVLIPYRKGDKWGFCGKHKNIVIECKYDFVSPFIEGVANVLFYSDPSLVDSYGYGFGYYSNRRGYVDMNGKEIIPLKYRKGVSFSENRSSVSLNNKCGFIDKTGKTRISFKYNDASNFQEGLARVKVDGKFGFINKTGKEIVSIIHDDAGLFSEGLAWVKRKNEFERFGYEFINKKGKAVINFTGYDGVEDFSEGLARVELDGKYGFIDKTGQVVIDVKYNHMSSFHEGLAWIKKTNGKYGFVDQKFREIIECKYDITDHFSEGLAPVKYCGKWGFIDKTGNTIIGHKYDAANRFSKGLAIVELEIAAGPDPWGNHHFETGYIDKNGTEYWED